MGWMGGMSLLGLPPSPGVDTWMDPPPFAFLQPGMQSWGTAAALEQMNRTRERAGVCKLGPEPLSPAESQIGHLNNWQIKT